MIPFQDLGKIEERNNLVLSDQHQLTVLFSLQDRDRMTTSELLEALNIEFNTFKDKILFLEEAGYIRQNPCKDNIKPFNERRYILDIKGVFLLNKIKKEFSQYFN